MTNIGWFQTLFLTATELCVFYEFIVSESELNITEVVRIGLVYKGYFETVFIPYSALSFRSNGFHSTEIKSVRTTAVIHPPI